MQKPSKLAQIPQIRFSGFTDPWERRKLDKIADVRDGTHDSPKYQSSGHPFITSKNVKNGFINYDDIQYISDEDFEEINKRSKVDINDILMGMIGTIGNTALIRTKPDFAIKNVALIKDTKQVNYLYLYHFLYSPFVEKQLSASMDGGTQKFIALGNIRNLDILFPGAEEQRRLGQYFSNLDNLITLHQSKFEKLQKIKKSCLQNLFPQNNQNTPKIRFKNFTDEWAENKLGEICTITMGQSPNGATYSEIPSDYILVQGNADLKNGFVYPRIYTTQKTKMAYIGDLIMSVRAPAGAMGKTLYNVVLGRGVAGIKGNEFIYQNLIKFDMEGYWSSFSAGSTFESLNSNVIFNAKISIPNSEEQEKIGAFFSKLDKLITLQQRKVEKLKNIKKALLNKMFI